MKNYIGFSNDHSGSMQNIARAAARDFNATVSVIKQAALANNIDTIVNVVQNGIRTARDTAAVVRQVVNSNIHVLNPIPEGSYVANGAGTPLFDSVGELIELMSSVPDANDPDVTFLVFVTTDGGENHSRKWNGHRLGQEIQRLQQTDRWTFVFRVPRGHARHLTSKGIPEGNIQEWDQSDRGMQVSQQATAQAFNDYYTGRTKGVRSTSTFYSSLKNVSTAEVKAALKDISAEVTMWPVLSTENGAEIRPFVEKRLNKPMLKGSAFYQLMKTESKVQDYKMICIREKKTGLMYYGPAARQLIGLPASGDVRLHPGDHGEFDIFIQSTSVNRKLVAGTQVMYWPHVGKAFTEGPSYQPASAVAAQAAAVVTPQNNAQPLPVVAKQAVPTSGKIQLVRKKDGVFVKEVSTMAEAQAEIDKAKRGKKAALVVKQ